MKSCFGWDVQVARQAFDPFGRSRPRKTKAKLSSTPAQPFASICIAYLKASTGSFRRNYRLYAAFQPSSSSHPTGIY